MSAVLLRKAASEMRRKAEAASEPPWGATGMWWYPVLEIDDDGREVERSHGFHAVNDRHGSGLVAHAARPQDAEHIASWHPAVALAVADWLDAVARSVVGTSKGDVPFEDEALAVARAYLGEA